MLNVEEMRAKQNELLVMMLFSEKSGNRWTEYRHELMTKYSGDIIMKHYENKIKASRLKK